MRMRWSVLAPAIGIVMAASLAASSVATAVTTHTPPAAAGKWVMGKHYQMGKYGTADCNGYSKRYKQLRPQMRELCADPTGVDRNGHRIPFEDNGHYIGHDEPTMRFLSATPNSANTFTTWIRLPVDPKRAPTPNGSVTNYMDLSVAPWIGLPLCDPGSMPQNPCTPDSNSNFSDINNPSAAGAAFMEMQFYAPGYTPFQTSQSCSVSQWCAALNIDSLECTTQDLACNDNCIEPAQFALIQTDGVPAGPPAPQAQNNSTFSPNGKTLMMNQGDLLKVSVTDPPSGLTITIRDVTTGHTGFMTASAANGFMTTSIADCSGTPYTYHAEYNSALPQNSLPWGAGTTGVMIENEIGHSESCASLASQDPNVSADGSLSDQNIFDTCVGGGNEGASSPGEGPCDPNSGICTNASTQGDHGPVACNDPIPGDSV